VKKIRISCFPAGLRNIYEQFWLQYAYPQLVLFSKLPTVYFYFYEVSKKSFNLIHISHKIYELRSCVWVVRLNERLATYFGAKLAQRI